MKKKTSWTCYRFASATQLLIKCEKSKSNNKFQNLMQPLERSRRRKFSCVNKTTQRPYVLYMTDWVNFYFYSRFLFYLFTKKKIHVHFKLFFLHSRVYVKIYQPWIWWSKLSTRPRPTWKMLLGKNCSEFYLENV